MRSRLKSRRRAIALVAVGLALLAVVLIGIDRTAAGPAGGSDFFRGDDSRPAPGGTLRVATFNIHGGRGADGQRDLELTAYTLEGFDLVGLNEVHGAVLGGRDQAEVLGRRLKLSWLFAPSERRWWRDSFGNAALTSCPVRSWRREPLENSSGHGYRNLTLLELEFAGGTISALVTHIDRTADRRGQLDVALRRFLELPAPALLLGDLNSPADDPAIRAVLERPGVVDPLALFGEEERPGRIDWVLVRGLDVLDAGVRDLGASDHPCVWAELALP